MTASKPLWRLEGRDGMVIHPKIAALRFISEAQAWEAADRLFGGTVATEGPHGVAAVVGPVLDT